jgi:hypothetical protein
LASIERYTPGNPVVVKGLEGGSTQTFDAGDPVKFSAGYVVVATAGVMNGLARRDASGTQSTQIEVELFDPNAVYSAKCSTDLTHAQTLVGTNVDFQFTTPGSMVLEDGTTDAYVVALDPRDAAGTTSGRLLIRFHYGTFEATD